MLDSNGDPALLKAEVKIPQVQELLGTDAATTIRLFQEYVDGDFDAATGVFAEIAKPKLPMTAPTALAGMEPDTLGVDFSSDKAGGFATPNLGVSTLTRSLGPLAGKAADAVTDTFDPASFFGGGLAKLFGSFDLADLLPASTLGKNAPKLRTTSSDIPNGKLVVTTLDWEPEVENKDLTVVEFVKDHGGQTELKVHGVITKPVVLSGTPDPPTFEFTGTLNDFRSASSSRSSSTSSLQLHGEERAEAGRQGAARPGGPGRVRRRPAVRRGAPEGRSRPISSATARASTSRRPGSARDSRSACRRSQSASSR